MEYNVKCAGCGNKFIKVCPPSHFQKVKNFLCSNTCKKQFMRAVKTKGKTLICPKCGKSFHISPSKYARGQRYCSMKCKLKYPEAKTQQERWMAYYYAKKKVDPTFFSKTNNRATRRYKDKTRFNGIRGAILKRDNCQCSHCGVKEGLVIHHIDGVSYHNSDSPNSDPKNLITMCKSCHTALHHKLGSYPRSR